MITLALTWILAAVTAHAGSETGNGGQVIACPGELGRPDRITLRDYFNPRHGGRPIVIDLRSAARAGTPPLAVALHRLATLAPERARVIRSWARSFESEIAWSEAPLPLSFDEGYPDSDDPQAIPPGCSLVQVVLQSPVPQGKRYRVFRPIWDRLTAVQRAGLTLHELLYRTELQMGAIDSHRARRAVALLSSKRYREAKPLLGELGFLIRAR